MVIQISHDAIAASSGERPKVAPSLRILALLPDAFGGHGGIAQYNRDLLTALCEDPRVQDVVAIVRWMPNPLEQPLPDRLLYETAGVSGWLQYVLKAFAHCLRGKRFHLVVCGHLHLVPLAVFVARVLKAPILLEIYGIEAWKPSPSRMANRLLGSIDHVISISDFTRRRFLAWSGISKSKLSIVPNAIHLNRYGVGSKDASLARRYRLSGRRVLMTFGRLVSRERAKGFDEILELLPRLKTLIPDVTYVVAGDGEDKARLEAKARALGVADRVVFTGMVREEEKSDLYRLADAYVMPSRGEGFGFVFLEAMACGIPVVASKVDGSREAVCDGELGNIVDPDNPAEIEAAILESLSRPKTVPAGLEYFSFERFRARVGGILDQLNTRGAR